jgi:superfamily II DNA/RNA helicase
LIIPTRDEEAARQVADVFFLEKRRGGIVFSPTVDHAESFAANLRTFSLKAEAISSRLDARERDRLMASFRRGDLGILTSVDLFNEGVDVPDADLIVFMRATHSRRIFVQQLGRGLRMSPDKDKVIVLDFVTDLQRIAEVVELEKASAGPTERLPLGHHLISFRDESAGSFMLEWMKDQANLMLREGDAQLALPKFEYPNVVQPGVLSDSSRRGEGRGKESAWEEADRLEWSALPASAKADGFQGALFSLYCVCCHDPHIYPLHDDRTCQFALVSAFESSPVAANNNLDAAFADEGAKRCSS